MNKTSSDETMSLYTFRFERYILQWISAMIGIVFSILSLLRYFRHNYQRTQLTYVYHFSLGFSLLLCFLSTPLHTLTNYYLSISSNISDHHQQQQQRLLCNFDLITFFISSAGIGYSIAYANLERTFFIFYSQNIRLTWIRQFTPFLIIFIYCSLTITLFVLLSKYSLNNSSCLLCYVDSLHLQILWFFLQFLFPFCLMLIAICLLIYHIEIYTNRIRTSINRKRSQKRFQRILIHLNVYSFYYLVSICPINIYLLIRNHWNIQQSIVDIILINYLFIMLNGYSILIFFLTKVHQQQRVTFHQEQKQSPYIIITRPSIQLDEYERTRL